MNNEQRAVAFFNHIESVVAAVEMKTITPFNRESFISNLASEFAEAWKAGRDYAAAVLDNEVKFHRRNNTPHSFCEDYGCTSLESFAEQIRALQPPAQTEGTK